MNRSIPPRLRAPALLAVGALVVLAVGGATHGWSSVVDVAPIPILLVAALFVWSGRDSDPGALLRRRLDERQEYQRLKVQALVGRVLSLGVAVAYLVASATKTTLWPEASLLGLLAISFVVGWLLYGEHGMRRNDDTAA